MEEILKEESRLQNVDSGSWGRVKEEAVKTLINTRMKLGEEILILINQPRKSQNLIIQ